ncbi:MAG: hypothetical protein ACK4SZ_13805 [Allosphingosinicella sp.]|uniref:hypothetical protein n=1 Tax=Allosphingosinicella sp. TaxID=2823234 RepID=UPI0039523197
MAHEQPGLPAGAVHLKDRQLILAGTPCDPPLFQEAMHDAAAATGADVILIHHGLHPEVLNPVRFSVLVHMSREPQLLEDMVLYYHQADGYWLVPTAKGLFIALQEDGLRVDFEPPFITFHERSEGVCHAAAMIVRGMRKTGAM